MLNLVRLIKIKLQYMIIAFIYYLCEITMISGTVLYCKSHQTQVCLSVHACVCVWTSWYSNFLFFFLIYGWCFLFLWGGKERKRGGTLALEVISADRNLLLTVYKSWQV